MHVKSTDSIEQFNKHDIKHIHVHQIYPQCPTLKLSLTSILARTTNTLHLISFECTSQWQLEHHHGDQQLFVFTKIGPGGWETLKLYLESTPHALPEASSARESLNVAQLHILFPAVESCSCSWKSSLPAPNPHMLPLLLRK